MFKIHQTNYVPNGGGIGKSKIQKENQRDTRENYNFCNVRIYLDEFLLILQLR